MSTFYTDSGSLSSLEISGSAVFSGSSNVVEVLGSGSAIFVVSGSNGALLQINDDQGGTEILAISSGSNNYFVIEKKSDGVSAKVTVTGSIEASAGMTGSLYGTASWALNLVGGGATTPAESYFMYPYQFTNTSVFALNSATNATTAQYIAPVQIPQDMSIGFMRFYVTNTFASTTFATTANQSYSVQQTQTWWANFYSQGTGASSRSLMQMAQASATMLYQIRAHVGAASNNQTVSHNLTYFVETGSAAFASNYNVNAASVQISSTPMQASFSGNRFLDLPMNSSLAAGAYWIAIQRSSATATTGGQLSNITNNQSFFFQLQVNSNFSAFGQNTTAAATPIEPGLGIFAVTTHGQTNSAIALTNVLTTASHPKVFFQLQRFS